MISFVQNTGPITDIHLWGAWLNDNVDFNTTFWLGIYDDVPAVTNGPVLIPSRPGTNLIWQQYFWPPPIRSVTGKCGHRQFYDPEREPSWVTTRKFYYYCFYPTNPPTQTGTVAQAKTYWAGCLCHALAGNCIHVRLEKRTRAAA
jgi:hypothetical protein